VWDVKTNLTSNAIEYRTYKFSSTEKRGKLLKSWAAAERWAKENNVEAPEPPPGLKRRKA